MAHTHRHFVPAAGADWALRFYDPLTRLLGMPSAIARLLEQAQLAPGQRVLDLGCGTGATTLAAKRACAGIEIVGLDPDVKALERARAKAQRAGLEIEFRQGFGDTLPFPDASFDRVLSSFMFHHLEPEQKPAVLREIARVLRPGGRLHLLDFGGAGHGLMSFVARLVHRGESLRSNSEDALAARMRECGFARAEQVGQGNSLAGSLAYFRAQRPPA
jgi:ubiquinone/menaquinone biosynthesis C-methylase UbiE